MYTRIESRFWQDEKMRAVTDDARYLMLYLLTSPHRNIMGFYFLPSPYACFDLGWVPERFTKGLNELLKIGVVLYDEVAHVILIQNYLKHNPLENPNQVKSAIGKLNEMPQTLLFKDFKAVLTRVSKPLLEPLLKRLLERLAKQGTGTGTGTGTEVKDNVATDVAQNLKTAPAGKPKKGGAQSKKTGKGGYTKDFEEFWSFYPRKLEKKGAFRAWNARIKEGIEPFDMIRASENYATYCTEQGTGSKFIKHGSTFIGPDKPFVDFMRGPPETATREPRAWGTLRRLHEKYEKEEAEEHEKDGDD